MPSSPIFKRIWPILGKKHAETIVLSEEMLTLYAMCEEKNLSTIILRNTKIGSPKYFIEYRIGHFVHVVSVFLIGIQLYSVRVYVYW